MSDPNAPEPGRLYRHKHGGLYRVIVLALEEATKNLVVVYRGTHDGIILDPTRVGVVQQVH